MQVKSVVAAASLVAALQSPAPDFDAISSRIDPHVDRQRVIVLTDIANEPDDQMSMVRFLLYSNEFDVEGLIAGTAHVILAIEDNGTPTLMSYRRIIFHIEQEKKP